MINVNKTAIRVIAISIVLLATVYLFTQSFYYQNHFRNNNHQDTITKPSASASTNEAPQRISFPDDYFHYGSFYQHENPETLTYPHNRFKAAFITFVKNDKASLSKLRFTVRNLEDQFNKHHHYPYIIFTDQDLDDEFRELASSLAGEATMRFEKVGSDLYGYEPTTDLKKAEKARITLNNTMFGDSEDYRFQSRFMAGTIYRHPLMQELDYSWRFEAGTEYICPMEEDPFQFMFENKKTTSFSMALYEYRETIPTLFQTVLDYASKHSDWIRPSGDPKTLWHFILDENNLFNGCHLWNNFQIADVSFYRGEKYQSFFNYLDTSNGIFYERWGDPVIQSLGATLFLTKDDIHFWDNIGYRVANYFTHCPSEAALYSRCTCRPEENFDFNGYSCLKFY
ncbi:alpha 1,2-mannosyltransferase [Mucor ambiguus]|uniref:Alpha 1,2-mannosyltransferase n=1 Tax=Mucor ambiguus TaxID=91626 RepID=A0A0C9MIQ2_9FUNG|nr:alpha 1,2-mannosyltransferase [Mucor ambiguus]